MRWLEKGKEKSSPVSHVFYITQSFPLKPWKTLSTAAFSASLLFMTEQTTITLLPLNAFFWIQRQTTAELLVFSSVPFFWPFSPDVEAVGSKGIFGAFKAPFKWGILCRTFSSNGTCGLTFIGPSRGSSQIFISFFGRRNSFRTLSRVLEARGS